MTVIRLTFILGLTLTLVACGIVKGGEVRLREGSFTSEIERSPRSFDDKFSIKQSRNKGARDGAISIIPRKQFWEVGRPKNLHQLTYTKQGDADLCGEVLQSLNQTRIWSEKFSIGSHDGWEDTLLGSKHSLSWEYLGESDSPRVKRIIVDIDNNGENDAVYRVGQRYASRFFSELLATPILPSPNEVGITPERLLEIKGPKDEIWIGSNIVFYSGRLSFEPFAVVDYPPGYEAPSRTDFLGFGQFKSIWWLGNEALVLVGSGYEFRPEMDTVPPIRVFRPRGYYRQEFVCELKYQYTF